MASHIGRYRVRGRVGAGGFATVWRAFDERLNSDVAVKMLADNWVGQGDVERRFVEEARVLRRADSDWVVRVYDIDTTDDGRPYFVMSFGDRGALSDRLRADGLPVADVLWYAVEAARGVAVLHGLGVIHRDVKPSNILFRTTATGEQLMVADLGLAKAVTHRSDRTVAGGTPGYMAPEQAGQAAPDERCDVYALGALTYHLLVGRAPPAAGEGRTPVPPSSLRGDLPAGADAVVLQALAVDRAHRLPDAAAFAEAVARLRAYPAAPTPPRPGPSSMRAPSHRAQATTPGAAVPATSTDVGDRRVPARSVGGASGRRVGRLLAVITAGCLVVLLGGVGAVAAYVFTPRTIRTDNGSVAVDVPRDWVMFGVHQDVANMGDFGDPYARGQVLSTLVESTRPEGGHSPSITVVASRGLADEPAKELMRHPPERRWDVSHYDSPKRLDISVDGFHDGTLRVWSGDRIDFTLIDHARARLYGDGFVVEVFMTAGEEVDADTYRDVVESLEVDGTKLP